MHYHLSRRPVDIGGRGDCLHLSRQVGGEAVVQEEKGELVARISFTEHIFLSRPARAELPTPRIRGLYLYFLLIEQVFHQTFFISDKFKRIYSYIIVEKVFSLDWVLF